jgi:hypothetical protein
LCRNSLAAAARRLWLWFTQQQGYCPPAASPGTIPAITATLAEVIIVTHHFQLLVL